MRVAPVLSSEVPPLFVGRITDKENIATVSLLLADVERQWNGVFRLAGGMYRVLNGLSLEQLADHEDEHAYHRLYWAVRYARAVVFGHERALEGFTRDWTIWLEQNRENDLIAQAAYTVSERIASLAECLFWLQNGHPAAVGRFAVPIKQQVWRDADHLASHVEYGLGVHNHLLNDARALFLAAALLRECPEAEEWERQAFEIWDTYFPRLVLDDGALREQSSHYHLLLCRTALEYCLAVKMCRRELPPGFEEKVRRMFRLANDLVRPDGSLPRFGDNSPDHTVEDLWGLLSSAYHYGLLDDAPRHPAVTPLTLYYCGVVPDLPRRDAGEAVRLYPNAGFAFLRSPESNTELAIHGDPRPEICAHGDAGQGSFEVWWQDRILIREPGSFASAPEGRRNWSRGAEAQNVTSLDGLPPGIAFDDRRHLSQWYWPQGGAWKVLPEGALQFEWYGFRRLAREITLRRTWCFGEDGALLLEEEVDGSRRVRFASRLCLGDTAWGPLCWDEVSRTGTLRWQRDDGNSVRMTLQLPEGLSPRLIPGRFLPEYGVELPAQVLFLEGTATLPLRWSVRWEFMPVLAVYDLSSEELMRSHVWNRRNF